MTREEAIRRIKAWNLDSDDMEVLAVIIPELKENEDERIRMALIKLMTVAGESYVMSATGFEKERLLAYLEKQKEKEKYDRMQPVYDNLDSFESALAKAWKAYNDSGSRTVDGCEDDYVECAHAKGFREGYLFGLEKQKEQKPNIELIQRSWYMEGYHDREFGKEPKWVIKTGEGGPKHELNPRYGQPLTEQRPTEEQLHNLNEAIKSFRMDGFDRIADSLHSLYNILKAQEQHPSPRFLPNDWVVYNGPLGHAILQVKDVVAGRYSFVDNVSTLLVEDSDKFLRPLTTKDVEKPAEWSDKGRRGRIGITPKHIREKAENFLSKMEPPYDADDICSAYETGAMENANPSWGEEDKRALNNAIVALSMYANGEIPYLLPSKLLEDVERLKSLRPQYHGDITMTEAYKMGLEAGKASSWKPSEEQMSMLLAVINDPNNAGAESCYMALKSIYNNLKKL